MLSFLTRSKPWHTYLQHTTTTTLKYRNLHASFMGFQAAAATFGGDFPQRHFSSSAAAAELEKVSSFPGSSSSSSPSILRGFVPTYTPFLVEDTVKNRLYGIYTYLVFRAFLFAFSRHRYDQNLTQVRFLRATPGHFHCSVVITPVMENAWGTLHAGAYVNFMDTLSTVPLMALDFPRSGASVEMSLNFLRPARQGMTVYIDTKVVKYGKTLGFIQTDFYTMDTTTTTTTTTVSSSTSVGSGPKSATLLATARHTKAMHAK